LSKTFERARIANDNNGIGGMVVCDSSDQAKMMHEIFQDKYARITSPFLKGGLRGLKVAEAPTSYNLKKKQDSQVNTAAVILHDICCGLINLYTLTQKPVTQSQVR